MLASQLDFKIVNGKGSSPRLMKSLFSEFGTSLAAIVLALVVNLLFPGKSNSTLLLLGSADNSLSLNGST